MEFRLPKLWMDRGLFCFSSKGSEFIKLSMDFKIQSSIRQGTNLFIFVFIMAMIEMFRRYYKTISNSWNSRDVNFYDKYLKIFNNYLHMEYTEIHFKVQKFFWLKKLF